MPEFKPVFTLSNLEILADGLPWAQPLDCQDLGILLIAQPWLTRDGWRRADLERELTRLSQHLPLGKVYFQRIKRAVSKMEDLDLMHGSGTGRTRRYTTSPSGFVALIFHLGVLHADPTVDGSEFEFKRAVITLWSLLVGASRQLAGDVPLDPAIRSYFSQVQQVEILGKPWATQEKVDRTLDLRELIALQRRRVELLMDAARRRRSMAAHGAQPLESVSPARLHNHGFSDPATLLSTHPTVQAVVREVAGGALELATSRSAELRYRHYLDYLDSLEDLYDRELLPRIDLELFCDAIA